MAPSDDLREFPYESWKLTLPTGESGKPTEVYGNEYASLSGCFFYSMGLNAFLMSAPVKGVTTPNSKYPRCEFREMTVDGKKASWSNGCEDHRLRYLAAVTELPQKKPHIVVGQIHDGKDDVIQVRHEGKKIIVTHNKTTYFTLEDDYVLGSVYGMEITVKKKGIDLIYNKANYHLSFNGDVYDKGVFNPDVKFEFASLKHCYFRVGCYTQSNLDKDTPSSRGVVYLQNILLD